MTIVLGIDAAWTPHGSSGIALLRAEPGRIEIIAHATSYQRFIAWEPGRKIDWAKELGAPADIPALLGASERFAGAPVDLVAIDMPLSHVPITKRRCADDEVSRRFGAAGAGVHSPSLDRPGPIGAHMTEAFVNAGYALATSVANVSDSGVNISAPRFAEVFPLAALVRLMDRARRPAYKVGKIAKSWRHVTPPKDRLDALLSEWAAIVAHLSREIDVLNFDVPPRSTIRTASELKPYEDVLDAIVCAWIGLCIVENRAEALGNNEAAIWIPTHGRNGLPFSAATAAHGGYSTTSS